jgi:hypothetical protein
MYDRTIISSGSAGPTLAGLLGHKYRRFLLVAGRYRAVIVILFSVEGLLNWRCAKN